MRLLDAGVRPLHLKGSKRTSDASRRAGWTMTGRVMFVGTFRIPEDRLDDWERAARDMVDFVGANVPTLISFDMYVDDERREGAAIYVHPDSASLEKHLAVAASRIGEGTQMVEVQRIDLYGAPSPEVVERMRQMSTVPVNVKRHYYGR